MILYTFQDGRILPTIRSEGDVGKILYLAKYLSPEGILRNPDGSPMTKDDVQQLFGMRDEEIKTFLFRVDSVLIWTSPIQPGWGYFHFNEMYLEHHFGPFSSPERPHIIKEV